MGRTKIVAEIGCNHNGNVELAFKMIDLAKRAGADAVKFQTFVAEELVSEYAPKADYQKARNPGESQLDMLRKLELSQKDYLNLKSYAEHIGIQIFSTPFDAPSFEFLRKIGQKIWKIPAGEVTNLVFLEGVANVECEGKEIILSTGMSSWDEIDDAVNVLSKSKNTEFTILHCNTDYPTKDTDMNIRAMLAIKERYPNWKIGLSDHSIGDVAAVAAVTLGAEFIEKHFTLDRNLPGPDHKASIDFEGLAGLCERVRRVEVMLGREDKFITDSEKPNRKAARKSIVAKTPIKKGEIFTKDNLACKRPGSGISPMRWYDVIGKTAPQDFGKNELIILDGFSCEE